jgi:hypothetical protein
MKDATEDQKQYDDLRKLYRDARQSAFYGVTLPGSPASEKVAADLSAFCLATGRDLEELNRFFQEVDRSLVPLYGS